MCLKLKTIITEASSCVIILMAVLYIGQYRQWLEIEPLNAEIIPELWKLFKAQYNKQYESTEEEAHKRSAFAENMKKVVIHNQKYKKGKKSYWLGTNYLSDLTVEEFKALYCGCIKMTANLPGATCSRFLPLQNVILPDTVDWRGKGYVTPVKNQSLCGSCWAFSATGSLEGQYFRKTWKLISFSEQELVDCSIETFGCEGGQMDKAFQYINKYGIESEVDYPYVGKVESCKYYASKIVIKTTGYVDIDSGCESALQQAVATIGPVSVAIDASHSSFQQYSGGVYEEEECSSAQLNHAVLVVGYGTLGGRDYWLVKNSWGELWGDNGYIKMARNKGNMCGIATQASYPLV